MNARYSRLSQTNGAKTPHKLNVLTSWVPGKNYRLWEKKENSFSKAFLKEVCKHCQFAFVS